MSYTIAVSGINATDNPGPGTGIARSLKESKLDVKIIGFAYDSMEPGISMDWLIDKSYIMPYPSSDVEFYKERISYINDKNKIDVIIPSLDVELPLYMKIENDLKKMDIGIMIPSEESFKRRGKDKISELAGQIGLKTPESINMTSFKDIDDAIIKFGFPLMIKGPFYEAYKVNTKNEAIEQFNCMAIKWGFPIIAQKYIYGEEYNLIGLGDGKGKDIGHVAVKKMLITKLGKIWTNVSIKNEKISKAATKMNKVLKWNGGYELELMLDSASKEFYLIEINPRFPAWIYMASAIGVNLPERMVRKILRMSYEKHSNYLAGKVMIRYTSEIIKDIMDYDKLITMGEN